MENSITCPFLMCSINNPNGMYSVNAALEHIPDDTVNCMLSYTIEGKWYTDQYAQVSWARVRERLLEIFAVTEYAVLCLICLGECLEQERGEVPNDIV